MAVMLIWSSTQETIDNNIKKPCESGEACSVDQIVISSPGMIPQATRKIPNRYFFGIKLTVNHNQSYMHAHNLEYFTSDETLDAKHSYNRHDSSCGKTARKFRYDNGRFKDAVFLEDAHNRKQDMQFCSVGAYQ